MDASRSRLQVSSAHVTARLSDRVSPAVKFQQLGSWLRAAWLRARLPSVALSIVFAVSLSSGCVTRTVHSPSQNGQVPSAAALPVAANDAIWGSALAPVTVFAFLDLECPFCAEVHPVLRELQRRYGPERLRLVIKHAPLPFHPRAVPAARLAQFVFEARGVDALLAFMGQVFTSRRLDDSSLLAAAREYGGEGPLTSAGQRARWDKKIEEDRLLGEQVGVVGVPAFFVNGALVEGSVPVEQLAIPIEHELLAAEQLRRSGTSAADVYAARVAVNFVQPDVPGEAADEPAYQVPVAGSPALGANDAWVTIVEFVDFECVYCRKIHPVIERLVQADPRRVRWVVKHNPLSFHKHSVPAAILAAETFRQRGSAAFFSLASRLVNAKVWEPQLFDRLGNEFQLDQAALRLALQQGAAYATLLADQDLASDLDAGGTPHFFINGRRLAGARPEAEFRALIHAEIERAERWQKERQGGAVASGGSYYTEIQRTAAAPPLLRPVHSPALAASTPRWGPADAPVTLQIFSDFECQYCRQLMFTLRQLSDRYPRQLQFAWRQLPLSFHKHAERAALASMAVRAQLGDRGFWHMTDAVFALGRSGLTGLIPAPAADPQGALDESSLTELAVSVGAERERFLRDLQSSAGAQVIDADTRLAGALGVHGTPAVLVNDYLVVGAQPLRRFDRLVRLSLAR